MLSNSYNFRVFYFEASTRFQRIFFRAFLNQSVRKDKVETANIIKIRADYPSYGIIGFLLLTEQGE